MRKGWKWSQWLQLNLSFTVETTFPSYILTYVVFCPHKRERFPKKKQFTQPNKY